MIIDYYKISRTQLLASGDRKEEIMLAKSLLFYLLREYTNKPLKEIGRIAREEFPGVKAKLGYNHATVLHHIDKVFNDENTSGSFAYQTKFKHDIILLRTRLERMILEQLDIDIEARGKALRNIHKTLELTNDYIDKLKG